MKNELKISTLAIVCVLCTAVSAAYGASSVRTLGGSGTYSSASSAAAANTSSASSSTTSSRAATRGGSVRVTPSSGKTGGSTTIKAGTTTGRVATTPRLSIGKYLGGSTSVSGGSSLRPQTPGSGGGSSSGGMDGETAAELRLEVDQLHRDVEDLMDKDLAFEEQLVDKQDVLTPTEDGFVIIDNNEIFVDVEGLKDALEVTAGQDGREVEIGSNEENLLWRYVGDGDWQVLISKAEITGPQGEVGPQGPKGEKGEPGDAADVDLSEYAKTADIAAKYATTEIMNQTIAGAIAAAAANYATAAQGKLAETAVQPDDLKDYAKTTDVANTYETKANASATYATKTDLSGKVDSATLAGYATKVDVAGATADLATKEELTTGLATKADSANVYTKAEVYNKSEVDDKVADVVAGDMSEALKGYAKTADVEAADKALEEKKADKSELANYATTDDLAGKADAATVTTLSGRVDGLDTEVGEINDLATDAANAAAGALTAATSADNKADKAASDAAAAKKAADAASTAAGEAKTAAGTAQTTANAASGVADEAKELATTAGATATAAKETADKAALDVASKADKSTTLAGYGITNAYTKTEVDDKLTNVATAEDLSGLDARVSANTAGVSELKTKVGTGELTTTDKTVVGAINELKSKTDGIPTEGNFEEMNEKITAVEDKLETKADKSSLGALAGKNQIVDADVADDAAIAKTKLAKDVQTSLDKADSAVSTAGAPKTGDHVMAVSNGEQTWFEVVY